MLQNIDVEDGVEDDGRVKVFELPYPYLANRRQSSCFDFFTHSLRKRGVRLQRNPLLLLLAQNTGGRPQPGTNLKNPRTDILFDARCPIGFPVGR